MDTPSPADTPALSPLKRAFLALEAAEARAAALERAAHAPVAVIGLGLRVPGGASDPDGFWRLMQDGVDAISRVPADRWDIERYFDADPEAPGKIATREAGFIERPDRFDPTFFGIAPREAQGMDPQQRLLLEVAWEALENAGQAPDRLERSATGVWVGVCSSDYTYLQVQAGDSALYDAHFTSGIAHSVFSGRLSYLLGLQGPSVTIDTACSSSLVAVHQAVQSLRSGETRMALAGGVNLMLAPDIFIALSHSRMLAPDGRCKTFDAAADGFARGEGCGVVVLKRLADAQADGDRVLAVIRGSAVNQDGPSSGLTAPNGPAQEAVIRSALADAGLAPRQVGYVEAHGTGTQLGDPLEVHALGAVFGADRQGTAPLVIGSVKTNIGHLEGAAGVTGLIKLVLALQQRTIPAHLHFRTPSPHIHWDEFPLQVPARAMPWAPIDGRRIGGVSSFGFSGTNAHVVVEEAPTAAPPSTVVPLPQIFTLSARDPAALRALAGRHAEALARLPAGAFAAACFTANTGRAHFGQRAAIVAENIDQLRERLAALAAGTETAGLRVAALHRRDPPRIAFVFTGQGSQYAGMARGLYDGVPAFRAALDRCAAALDVHLGRPLLELLFGTDDGRHLDRTEFTQPALFALEVALAETWRSFGVGPSVVMGHSVGEVAAACVAGVMTLEHGARLICERARLMGALPEGGAMAALQVTADAVAPHLAAFPALSIAATNSPTQTVVSGAAAQVDALVHRLGELGIRGQRLNVSHAFHSPLVEPMLDAFEQVARGITLAAPKLRLVSNLSGALALAGDITQAGYWRRHVREPVRFAEGVATLLAQRPDVVVEIGPQPSLLAFFTPAAPALVALASLRKGRPDRAQLLDALAALYLEGAVIDWRGVHAGGAGTPIALPTYPFQRERCWFKARPAAGAPRGQASSHPMLGTRLRSAAEQRIHESRVAADTPRWVAEHLVQTQVVLPATAYLDLLLAAATDRHGPEAATLEDVTIQEAMLLAADGGRTVQLLVDAPREGAAIARLCSLAEDADDAAPWTCHVTARLPAGATALARGPSLADVRSACPDAVTHDAFYADLARRGLAFGPAFRSVLQLWRGAGQALGEVALHASLEAERNAYRFHPVQLDGCLQVMAAALADDGDALFLPLSIGRYRLVRRPVGRCWAHVVADSTANGQTRRADVRIFDADGSPVAELLDLRLKRVSADTLLRLGERPTADLLHEITWRDAPTAAPVVALATLADAANAEIEPLRQAVGLDAFDACLPRLDALCAEFAARALAELGTPPTPGEAFDGPALGDRLRIAARHRQLLARLLAILAEQGWLDREGARWIVRRSFAEARPSAAFAAFTAAQTPIGAELELTGRTGSGLAGALRGDADPLQLLFPGGSTETAERVYRDSAPARLFNGLVAAAAAAAAQGRDAARPLRILEIGGGTGGTTAHVLPRLPAAGAIYTFTDVGPSFVARARERFAAAHGFVQFQVFDLEQDALAQGLPAQGFDLVLASNVVHATRDLRRSLHRIRGLLAPGGVLAMLEACAPQAWFDLTVGLTEGWWCFEDRDLRPDYATLPRAAWVRLLGECGFGDVRSIAGDPARAGALGLNTLLLAQAGPAPRVSRDWLLVGGEQGLASELGERLRLRGDRCELVPRVDMAELAGRRWHGVVHAVALDGPGGPAPTGPVLSALQLAQDLVKGGAPTRLWLLTREAQAAAPGDEVTAPLAAGIWGLARALRLEHPELAITCVDVDAGADADALLAELDDDGAENERLVRGARRQVARLVRRVREAAAPAGAPPCWRLAPAQPGSLERLVQVAQPRRPPGPGEVEIEVEASGLNFKDVLNVLGLYPGDAGPLGGECAGRVSAVGSGVTTLAVGDAVLAVAGGSFASHVVARAEFVQRRPQDVSAEEGASFAIAHLTAEFCLVHLAQLRPGQRVLVHAAAGGVGLAAVRIAQRAGAQVFATAGSAWKRDLLQSIGVAQVFDSRSPAFAAALLAATGGQGVDVVLNSLAGDLIEPSFDVLARGGCFVEIGKRGIKSAEWVHALGRDLRYHVVDWGETGERDPALIGAMLARLVEALRDGSLAPLPRHVFELADAARAFRFMAQARHAGRIVVRHPTAAPWRPNRRGSHLVSGGLSGIGLETARWLAERGAGRLVLIGRRGVTPEAMPVLAAMRAAGVEVITEALDVTDEAGLRSLLARVRASGPPLRGVWHSAGTLANAGLLQQDAAGFQRVFAPKVTGARLLDRLTRADALDCFVLFSSIAGVLGSAGQSNHSAASAVLDAIAHERAANALPALAIDWGAWRDIGAAADRETGERLSAQGLAAMAPAQGLAAMERLIERPSVQASVLDMDWATYRARVLAGRASPLLAEIGGTPAAATAAPRAAPAGTPDLRARLDETPPSRRRSVLAGFVQDRALRALGLEPSRALDPRTPLGELGLDSLLAVELRNTLATALGIGLPATLLFDHPTVDALTDHLIQAIFPVHPPDVGSDVAVPPVSAARMVDAIEELSDDEVERRLAAHKRPRS